MGRFVIRLREWYETPKEKRNEFGLKGRKWMLTEEVGMSCKNMCQRFIDHMETF